MELELIQWYIILSGNNDSQGHSELFLSIYSLIIKTISLMQEEGMAMTSSRKLKFDGSICSMFHLPYPVQGYGF